MSMRPTTNSEHHDHARAEADDEAPETEPAERRYPPEHAAENGGGEATHSGGTLTNVWRHRTNSRRSHLVSLGATSSRGRVLLVDQTGSVRLAAGTVTRRQ